MEPPEPDDPAAWLVYADWLQARGDPAQRALGEVIVLGAGTLDEQRQQRIDALVAQHRNAWLGPLAELHGLELGTWRGGFPREAAIPVSGDDASTKLVALLGHVMAARLDTLAVTTHDDSDGTLVPFFEWLATHGRRTLRNVSIANAPSFGGPYRTYPMPMGNVVGLWSCPLEHLILESDIGLELGAVVAPHVATLDLGVIGTAGLRSLADATLPALERLYLHVGPDRLHPDASWREGAKSLPAILESRRTPKLQSLGLATRYDVIVDLLVELASLRTLGRIEELDLAGMHLTDDHVSTLARCREACAQIPRVRVNGRFIRDKRAIPRLGKKLEIV